MSDRVAITSIVRVGTQPGSERTQDLVAIEAPVLLTCRKEGDAAARPLGVFMRTPGDDREFALGLLYGEGIIRTSADVRSIEQIAATDDTAETLAITLATTVSIDDWKVERGVLATSACGLCGRLSVAGLDRLGASSPSTPAVSPATISSLPAALRERQTAFAETGGLHAAAFFDLSGRFFTAREDVGRHNAVDKLIGAALSTGDLPARDRILVVSGRVAFEIVQKAAMAGVPILVAVGAPSSLAIDAARAAHLTLIGFARDGRFNVYSSTERILET